MPHPAVPQRICTITNQNLQIKHNAAYRADQDKHDRVQLFELPDTERQHEKNNYRRNIDADRMAAALYGIPGLMVVPRGPDLGAQVILKRKWS